MTLQTSHDQERGQWFFSIFLGIVALLLGTAAGALVVGVPEIPKVVVIIAGAFAFIASLARVEWGLLVLVFITYTRFSDVAIQFHGAPSTAKSFIGLLILAIVFRWIVYGEQPEGWQRPALFLVIFGVVALASVLYAADPARTQEAVMDYIKDAIIVVVIAVLLHREKLFKQVIWVLLAAGIFLGTLSVIQYLTNSWGTNFGGFAQAPVQHIVGQSSGRRVAGPIGDPNFYAQIMLVLIPLALDRFWSEEKRLPRLIALWALVVCGLTVVFTFSRGAFVAMAVTIVVMFIMRPPSFASILAILIIALLLVPFIPSTYTERMMTLTELTPDTSAPRPGEASFRGRASELLVAWMMFKDHPLLGVGYDNYPVYYQQYSRRVGLDPRLEQRAAHNLYIEIAAELGLVGIAAFGLILWGAGSALLQAWRDFKNARMKEEADMVAAFGVGLFGYLAAAMFIHDAYPRFLWLLIGISWALYNVSKREVGRIVK